jgi:phospholipase/lecithinase/hemolysin
MRRPLGLAVLAASLACSPAYAQTYSAIYSFGDSLSDVGNALIASTAVGDPIPLPAYYYDGRFSNGPNWLDDLAAKLGLSVSPALSIPPGNDFAFGGAQTGVTIVNPPIVGNQSVPIDLEDQVAFFKEVDRSPTPGALYTLDIGANDILNAVSAGDGANPTFLTQAVNNTVGAIDSLYAGGMRNLLYYEVPDLSVVPAYEALGPQDSAEAGALAKAFNTDVLKDISSLSGLNVFDVPIFSAIDEIVANPSRFGLTNVTTPCFSGNYDTAGSVCGDPNTSLFWDDEHPTAAANLLTANLAYDVLTGTTDPALAPEPSTWAMMLIGFAGLAFAGWRAQRSRAASAQA